MGSGSSKNTPKPAAPAPAAAPPKPAKPAGYKPTRKRLSLVEAPGQTSDASDALTSAVSVKTSSDLHCDLKFGYDIAVKPGFDPEDENESKECQDETCVIEAFMEDPEKVLICVFDGHGTNGRKAAVWCKREFPNLLRKSILKGISVEEAMKEACEATEGGLAKAGFDVFFSGSTATFLLIQSRTLHFGWVGDSRAVVGVKGPAGKMIAEEMTRDHKPDDPQEKMRILSCGGIVQSVGDEDDSPMRIFSKEMLDEGRWAPGLAMSRSVGDLLASSLGAIPSADYKSRDIGPDDNFVVLASDGLWEVFENDEAVKWIHAYVSRNKEAGSILPGHSKGSSVKTTAQAIAEEAQRRWCFTFNEEVVVDDTSVVICWLNSEVYNWGSSHITLLDHHSIPHRKRKASLVVP